jgi:hypothetical protein
MVDSQLGIAPVLGDMEAASGDDVIEVVDVSEEFTASEVEVPEEQEPSESSEGEAPQGNAPEDPAPDESTSELDPDKS